MQSSSPKTRIAFFFDPWLLCAVLALLGLGLLMVTSASMVVSDRQFGGGFHFFLHQLLYLLVGLSIGVAGLCVSLETWQKWSPILLLAGLILLVIVLIPGVGKTVHGSRRWLHFGVLRFQVSEWMKLSMVLFLAGYIVRRQQEVREQLSGFIKPLLLLAVVAVLLLMEPDFGATVVIVSVALGMLFLSGVRLRQFFPLFLLVGGLFAALAISAPYRLERIVAFLKPWSHQFDGGYQLTQSLMAFGRGGIWGLGLGNSVQKLFYLPEAHTDFLFAILGEELGLIGQGVVFLLFAIVVGRAMVIGRRAYRETRYFASYTAYGLGLWIGMQAIINIGVNMGVLPTKGLTLPFMSYGGSSLLSVCLAAAIVLRVYHEHACIHYQDNARGPRYLTVHVTTQQGRV